MAKKLTIKKPDKKLNDFGVFDIETIIIDGTHVPYCASYLDNKISFTYYISDNENLTIEQRKFLLLDQFFDKVIEVALGRYVFAHNFSKFDGFYLLEYFMRKVNEQKIKRNDFVVIMSTEGNSKIYSIEYKQKRKSVNFRDWYLLISESLQSLASLLNDPNLKKTIFPYEFLRENPSNLFYKGIKPDLKYFLSQEEIKINDKVYQIPL